MKKLASVVWLWPLFAVTYVAPIKICCEPIRLTRDTQRVNKLLETSLTVDINKFRHTEDDWCKDNNCFYYEEQ